MDMLQSILYILKPFTLKDNLYIEKGPGGRMLIEHAAIMLHGSCLCNIDVLSTRLMIYRLTGVITSLFTLNVG